MNKQKIIDNEFKIKKILRDEGLIIGYPFTKEDVKTILEREGIVCTERMAILLSREVSQYYDSESGVNWRVLEEMIDTEIDMGRLIQSEHDFNQYINEFSDFDEQNDLESVTKELEDRRYYWTEDFDLPQAILNNKNLTK